MVTEIVPVRAVNTPIGAFCTEFRCERFCEDDVFSDWVREMDHRGPLGLGNRTVSIDFGEFRPTKATTCNYYVVPKKLVPKNST